jgi:pimeloyl-ACP methyl ester carboxylesterase
MNQQRSNSDLNGGSPNRPLPGAANLSIDDGGSGGMPVVFVHSFAGNISHWSEQLAHLRGQRRAIAFDLSGHGQSKPAASNTKYSIRSLAKDLEAVARALRLDKFVLVGHSQGAAVAAVYAAAHPDKVAGLMLVDPPPAPGAIPASQVAQIISALKVNPYAVTEDYWKTQLLGGSRPEVQARLLQDLRKMSRASVVELTADIFNFDVAKELARYPGPKLSVVRPANDAPLSLHNAVPNVSHTTVNGVGHWIQLDKPAEFNSILDDFLKQVPA